MCQECPEKLKDTVDCDHLIVGWFPLEDVKVNPLNYKLWALAETAFKCERPPEYDGKKWVRAVCVKSTVYLDQMDIHIADLFPIFCQCVVSRPTEVGTFDVQVTCAADLHLAFIRTKVYALKEPDLRPQE